MSQRVKFDMVKRRVQGTLDSRERNEVGFPAIESSGGSRSGCWSIGNLLYLASIVYVVYW